MGRPINRKWFGVPNGTHHKIVVNAVMWSDGTTSENVHIVKQVGTRKYIVSDGVKVEPVFMVNATSSELIKPGECFILAKPFGGVDVPCQKITQYRVSVYQDNGTIGNYSWGTSPASRPGEADLHLALVSPGPTIEPFSNAPPASEPPVSEPLASEPPLEP